MTSKQARERRERLSLKEYTCPLCGGALRWEVDQWVCLDCHAVITEPAEK